MASIKRDIKKKVINKVLIYTINKGVKNIIKDIKYEYYEDRSCFYCTTTSWVSGLEGHHVYSGVDRKNSPVVYLCHKCHTKCHRSNKFLKIIQELYERTNKNNSKTITKESSKG